MSYTAKKWTSDEINKAVELFRKGKDYTYISGKIEDRSAFAVQCKMEFYVFDKINNGVTYETLATDLKRSEEELKKMYASQVKRNPGKPASTVSSSSVEAIVTNGINSLNLTPSPNNMYGIINRIVTPYVEFHENLEKLEQLSSNETINKKTYKNILKILESRDTDDEKFLEQLKKTVETKRITPVKSDSKTDESDVESDEEETKKDKNKKNKTDSEKQGSTKINIPRKRIL